MLDNPGLKQLTCVCQWWKETWPRTFAAQCRSVAEFPIRSRENVSSWSVLFWMRSWVKEALSMTLSLYTVRTSCQCRGDLVDFETCRRMPQIVGELSETKWSSSIKRLERTRSREYGLEVLIMKEEVLEPLLLKVCNSRTWHSKDEVCLELRSVLVRTKSLMKSCFRECVCLWQDDRSQTWCIWIKL